MATLSVTFQMQSRCKRIADLFKDRKGKFSINEILALMPDQKPESIRRSLSRMVELDLLVSHTDDDNPKVKAAWSVEPTAEWSLLEKWGAADKFSTETSLELQHFFAQVFNTPRLRNGAGS